MSVLQENNIRNVLLWDQEQASDGGSGGDGRDGIVQPFVKKR